MQFKVNKNQIIRLDKELLTTENVNSVECSFSFSAEYDGLEVFAVFYRDKNLNRFVKLTDGKCVVPWEMLETEGQLYIGAYGVNSTMEAVEKRMTSNAVMVNVVQSLDSSTSVNAAPSPELWEEYLAEMLEYKNIAEAAANTAEWNTQVIIRHTLQADASATTAENAAQTAVMIANDVENARMQAQQSQYLAASSESNARQYENQTLAYRNEAEEIKNNVRLEYDVQPDKIGVKSAGEATFTYTESLMGARGPQGPQGEAGKDGTGVTILGSYSSITALQQAHPTGTPGDAYLINGDLYVWSSTNASWENVGNIQGPKGDKGATGETGASGKDGADGADGVGIKSVAQTTTSTLDGGTNVITVTKTDGSTSTFQVRNGSKGDKGDKGDKGEKGDSGSEIVTGVGTAGSSTYPCIYNVTVPGITELKAGVSFIFIPISTLPGSQTVMNVNGLGQRTVTAYNGTDSSRLPFTLAGGVPYRLIYSGAYWLAENHLYPNVSQAYGTLSVSYGGTGAANPAAARTALGINYANLGTAPIANGGTGATDAVTARKNLGIYQYSGNISSSSSTAANAMHEQNLSAKTIFGLSSIPSNFQIVAGISLNANMNLTVAHTIGTDAIKVRMRNVSGASVGATTFYYSIIGMLR